MPFFFKLFHIGAVEISQVVIDAGRLSVAGKWNNLCMDDEES